jgi:hypothetical protein
MMREQEWRSKSDKDRAAKKHGLVAALLSNLTSL